MLQPPVPILAVDRFPALLEALLGLLNGLADEDWQRRVHGGEWTAKDLAQHLLGGRSQHPIGETRPFLRPGGADQFLG